jgi:phosphatidylglycerophosphate synthase
MDEYLDPDRPRSYVYKSVNNSLVDRYVLRHWWPLAMKLVPARASANAVSMLGNLGVATAFLVLSGLLLGPMPVFGRNHPWIFGVVAFCLFFYQTLDALDGIQARRTGSSGPLGEFVDHWFDSFNAFLIPLGFGLAFTSVPYIVLVVLTLLLSMTDWALLRSIRKTDTMVFPAVSTEEGQVIVQLFCLAVWIFGYDLWNNPVLLGHSVIFWVYIAGIVGIAIILLKSLADREALRPFVLMLASLLPISLWTALAYPGLGFPALLAGALLQGFSGSRFIGELLRERLVGLRYRPLIIDIVVMDLLLLATLLPGLPSWLPLAMAIAGMAWSVLGLSRQFAAMLGRIRETLGMGLWGPVNEAARLGMANEEGKR